MSVAPMPRLLIHVEGQTEENFVYRVLAPHLYRFGYSQVSTRMLGKSPQRDQRGGIRPWPEARNIIVSHLRRDPGAVSSTMVDYYGMPQRGNGAWPGRAGASAELRYPNGIEESLSLDIGNAMGGNFNPRRFIPYVMMHEFEAMLFSDCRGFARSIGYPDLGATLQGIRDGFDSPESIDDSPLTAPSKRIEALIPGYNKPLQGLQGTLDIGLDVIRGQCGHFRGWLDHLEGLGD